MRRPPTPSHGPDNRRHNKIEGQVRGVSRMVTDGHYCVDDLTQISAATRALP
ncbi:metal-sensitive transcriptional regulator [Streptomyces griseoincarnatus]